MNALTPILDSASKGSASATNPMHELLKFLFKPKDEEGHEIRVVVIDGQPWFVAKDVCDVLNWDGRRGSTRYLQNLENFEVMDCRVNVRGRASKIVSERGLYKLIMRSTKANAKPFQDSVTKTVLPSIRKNGGYIAGQKLMATDEMSPEEFVARVLKVADQIIKDGAEKLRQTQEKLDRMQSAFQLTSQCLKEAEDVLAQKEEEWSWMTHSRVR
ncbi:BRO family protein [Breoghania sp.]|uniref:BRO-N domain-containing protein n=1 Tax=Breoghania sp. TaxID=2065378 RepID=UPI0026147B84|nr:BRO family protein [Breoghania sp.]